MGLLDWFRKPKPRERRAIPPERLAEIAALLGHPLSVEDALAMMAEDDQLMKQRDQPSVRWLQSWIGEHMQPGDELWWYDTGGDSWENLCGENGFALLRGGKVVDFTMWLMN